MSPSQTLEEPTELGAEFRPAHAKGILLSGSFLPSEGGASLTRAPHLHRDFTTVSVRFAEIQDRCRSACAIRFHLGEHVHTDIVAYAANALPAGTKPMPRNFARGLFLGRCVYRFTNQDGRFQFGRYCIRPSGPGFSLHAAPATGKAGKFQFSQIRREVAAGPLKLQILVQTGTEHDTIEERPLVDFGSIYLTGIQSLASQGQRRLIFDSLPQVDGIVLSNESFKAL